VLLSTEGFAWLQENPTVRDEVVVSETVNRP
jgi:hypothetical protein